MPRRSVADAAATRARILDVARGMFAERGYADTPSREIAAAAGVTVGAIFHHFGSKPGLFRAVFECAVSELNTAAVDAFRASPSSDQLEATVASLRVGLSFARRPDFYRIVTVDGPVVLGADQWREIDSRMGLRTVTRGVAAMRDQGLIEDRPIAPLAVLIMGAMNNAGFALARGEEGVDVENLLAAFRRLIEGLAPPR